MQIKNINAKSIEDRLKKNDKEAYRYVICLKDLLEKQKELTDIAIKKLKDKHNRNKEE